MTFEIIYTLEIQIYITDYVTVLHSIYIVRIILHYFFKSYVRIFDHLNVVKYDTDMLVMVEHCRYFHQFEQFSSSSFF